MAVCEYVLQRGSLRKGRVGWWGCGGGRLEREGWGGVGERLFFSVCNSRVHFKAVKSPIVKTTRHQAVCMTKGSALSLVQHQEKKVNTHSVWSSIPVLAVTL